MRVNDNRRYFITDLIKFNKYKSYLELGIHISRNITYISKNTGIHCVGVDNRYTRFTDDFIFYLGTTDDFFKHNKENFDIIFIDACHEVEQVKRDLESALTVLNKFGIILIHDVDPELEEFLDPHCCDNSYKIVDWVAESHAELNILVLPLDESGLAIVNRKSDRRVGDYT